MPSYQPEEFARQLGKYIEQLPKKAKAVRDKAALQLLRGCVIGTPVGNPSLWKRPAPAGYRGGTARNAWSVEPRRVSVDPDLYLPGGRAGGTEGASQYSTALNTLAAAGLFGTVYVSNPVAYIEPLRRGHSSQQAQDWVAAMVESVGQQFREGVFGDD